MDIVTFHYIESEAEWKRIAGRGGAYEAVLKGREQGKVRLLGMTSHQRKMAARIAATQLPLDMLMLRYNAAHRGAEREVFPVTDPLRIPVVVYACLRWGALMKSTPDDPPGFVLPPPREWYRCALAHSSVAVALMAPDNRKELDHLNFCVLLLRRGTGVRGLGVSPDK